MPPLLHMMRSAVRATPERSLHLYLMHTSLSPETLAGFAQQAGQVGFGVTPIQMDDTLLADAPVTKQFPKEMYFRLFAAQALPQELDRVLYLDPDLVVLRSLSLLYDLELGEHLLAAADHMNEYTQVIHNLRLETPLKSAYINSGVLLMNLRLLRQEQDMAAVFAYIRENHTRLKLPDQDVINALYSSRILVLDPMVCNFDARYFGILEKLGRVDVQWLLDHTVVLHFCGKQKPWKESYGRKRLKVLWQCAAAF